MSTRGGQKKRVGLVKLLAMKYNIKTITMRMDIVMSQGKIYPVQSNNTQGVLSLIIYTIVGNLIDWEKSVKLDLTRNAAPVFDVTNKCFKYHDNSIYFFECDEDSITLKKISLEKMIVVIVHRYPITGIQAVVFWHDAKHISFDDEEDFLNN
jgi:hypothetical protein